jgi:hypothetical protein
VTAQNHKKAVTRWIASNESAHYLEPTRHSAALLTDALPPRAARRHEDKRREVRIASRYFSRDIEGLSRCTPCLNNQRRFRVILRLLP